MPVEDPGPVGGAVIATHTSGDFPGRPPHLHVLVTDGCFYGHGMSSQAPLFELKHLEEIFIHKVFKMLLTIRKGHTGTGEYAQDMSAFRI